jgi:hypothetical protein
VYLVAAVAGNVASFFGNPRALSLGASGAVFGVGGALAAHFYCNRCVWLGASCLVPAGLTSLAPSLCEASRLQKHPLPTLPPVPPLVFGRDVYGKRGDRVLHQLWQNLLINVLFATYAPQIDNWSVLHLDCCALLLLVSSSAWLPAFCPCHRPHSRGLLRALHAVQGTHGWYDGRRTGSAAIGAALDGRQAAGKEWHMAGRQGPAALAPLASSAAALTRAAFRSAVPACTCIARVL